MSHTEVPTSTGISQKVHLISFVVTNSVKRQFISMYSGMTTDKLIKLSERIAYQYEFLVRGYSV